MVSRLPDDYWRWQLPGQKRDYHNAAEEVAYFATHQPPKLGASAALDQGRYIAITVCSGCHGAALDGKGEDAGGIKAASLYNDAEFDRLLTTSSPDVSLSRRWTIPARSGSPSVERPPPRPRRAFTRVPLQFPGAG